MAADALIINADDLGLWSSVDDGILAAWQGGAISDSTVFATAPDLPAVLQRAGAAGLPVGIHLNLTYGAPLSHPAEIPALVTPAGLFMKRTQWTLPLPPDQVRRELTCQVARVLALGWSPTHLDSHHHVHGYPEVLAIVIELAQAHRLPVRAVTPEMRTTLRHAGIATPDHFTMAFYAEEATVATLRRLVEACPGGTLELMTHPGYANLDLPSSYRKDRERELSALTDPVWRKELVARGIALVGYREATGG